jgi:hypothetical protein
LIILKRFSKSAVCWQGVRGAVAVVVVTRGEGRVVVVRLPRELVQGPRRNIVKFVLMRTGLTLMK